MDSLGKRLHVNFLGYANWFMSIIISKTKEYFIPVDQDIYATSVVEKYLDTTTIKENPKFHRTTLSHDVILTKEYIFTSD